MIRGVPASIELASKPPHSLENAMIYTLGMALALTTAADPGPEINAHRLRQLLAGLQSELRDVEFLYEGSIRCSREKPVGENKLADLIRITRVCSRSDATCRSTTTSTVMYRILVPFRTGRACLRRGKRYRNVPGSGSRSTPGPGSPLSRKCQDS